MYLCIIPNFIFFWLWQAKQPGFSLPVLFVLCAVGRSSNMQNVPFVYMQLTLMVERLRLPFLAENPRNIEKITYLYFFRLVKLQNVPFVYTMHLTLMAERLRLPFLKSTQCKKLALNALWFTYYNLKSCKLDVKTKQKTSKC